MKGVLWDREGRAIIYKGEWTDDKKNGFGLLYNKGVLNYKGTMKNDLSEGKGILLYPNGVKLYKGEFKLG
jgi:antitoxin component YwqK of YwqJK toxin-antitoxin module